MVDLIFLNGFHAIEKRIIHMCGCLLAYHNFPKHNEIGHPQTSVVSPDGIHWSLRRPAWVSFRKVASDWPGGLGRASSDSTSCPSDRSDLVRSCQGMDHNQWEKTHSECCRPVGSNHPPWGELMSFHDHGSSSSIWTQSNLDCNQAEQIWIHQLHHAFLSYAWAGILCTRKDGFGAGGSPSHLAND